MALTHITVEPLGREHDRSAFRCGAEAPDRCLKQQARQDADKRSVQIDTLRPPAAVHAAGASNAPPICFARRRSSEWRYIGVVDSDACRRLSRTVVSSAPR